MGFLILLCVLTLVFAAIMYVARPGRSAAGDRERSRLLARPRPAQNAGQRPGSLAMAVALGGSAVFAGTALAGYHQQRLASSSGSDGGSGSSSDSGSSDGSGDSGGGSGCGGCGGGGD